MPSFPQVPHQNPVYASPFPMRATFPANIVLLYLITRKLFGEQYRSLISSLCSFLHSSVSSSLLGLNILLNTLFFYTFSLSYSLNVSDQVSQPYKATGKIIVLYIIIFKCLDSKLEDKRFSDALLSDTNTSMFQRKLLPPSSGWNNYLALRLSYLG